jgi:hypothetical protein
MADTPSLLVKKQFSYRGSTKTFTNRYHFSGGTPADDAHWQTLSDAVVTAEKAIYGSNVTIVQTVAYLAGSDIPHKVMTYSTAGTMSTTSCVPAPGDCAAMVRFSTDQFSVKNHPIYLYSWYHGAQISASTGGDTLWGAQKTLIDTYSTAWITGFSDGTNSYHRAGPRGAVALSRTTSTVVRHRDFRT